MNTQPSDPRALKAAAEQMDWQQVIQNGGPPCFHLIDGKFCGRAQRWVGHKVLARARVADHDFVPLSAIIQSHFAESVNGKLLEENRRLKDELNWQNHRNSGHPTKGGFEFYINEEWTGLATAALDVDHGWHAALRKHRIDPDDERVRVRRVAEDDALIALAQSQPPSMADELAEALRDLTKIGTPQLGTEKLKAIDILARYDAQKGQS